MKRKKSSQPDMIAVTRPERPPLVSVVIVSVRSFRRPCIVSAEQNKIPQNFTNAHGQQYIFTCDAAVMGTHVRHISVNADGKYCCVKNAVQRMKGR